MRGLHRITFQDRRGVEHKAVLELKFRQIEVHPPIGKQSRYPALTLTVIHARERGTPQGRGRIEWKLLTNLPVRSRVEAIEKLTWYALRWKIETFHKILKSGCKVEESRLRHSERLANFIALCCIVGWRVFWMTMLKRTAPDASPSVALTPGEVLLLDELGQGSRKEDKAGKTLAHYLRKLAKLGGYLARAHDPPPGNMVMWRGLRRLTDIQLGFSIAAKLVGN